jgi:hypothetical protein
MHVAIFSEKTEKRWIRDRSCKTIAVRPNATEVDLRRCKSVIP